MPLNKPSDFFEQKENEENLSDEKTKVETQKRILSPSGLLDEKEEVVVEENIEENIEEEVVVVDNTEDKNYQKIIELEKLVEQVKSQVSSIPKVIDYRKDIGQLSIELDRLRKAFGLSEAEKLLSKPVEFPEIKSYDEDIELLHKLVADIERKQEIVSLSEGLLDEPNSDSEKNFATLEDLSEHYRLFVNRIQQQLSTLGGGGIEDAPKSGGPYVRQGQKWVVSSLSDGDWIRDSVGINTTDSVGIGTTAKSAYQLYVEGNARVTGVLTVGQESITLNGDTNTLDLGGSSISKDSGGDLKIMGSGGGYAPVRASEFKIDADTVIDSNKNISAGIVTGVTYYGDGSNLTGIIAVGIGTTASINTSGIITASVLSSTTGTFGTVNVSGLTTTTNRVEVRSTDNTPGRVDLFCEVSNAHYARLQAPYHSTFSGNVVATLPTKSGNLIVGDSATIDNDINTSGIITASVLSSTTGTFGTVNVSGASTFSDEVSFGSTVTFGTASQNIKIYTNSTGQSTIQETGGGNLKILGDKMVLKNSADTKIFSEFVNGGSAKLYYNNSEKFRTTGIGVSIFNGTSETATIYGPSNLIIDPMPVGVGTTSGIVRIKGDLYVDGTTTTINSTTVEIADKVIGIATTCNTNLLTDGAGIGIGSDKTFLYHYNSGTNPSLKSSENLNIASGKGYQINQTEVLNATTLGSGITVSSLTSVGTLGSLNVSGISTFAGAIDANGDLDVDGHTELDNLNVSGIATFNGGITAIFGGITVNGGSLNLTGSTADLNVDGETDLDVTRIAETLSVGGISTFGSIIDANGDLDVDGHTELDNLNVSGISTFEGKVNADAGLEVSGGVLTANNNINTYAVRYALSSNTRLAFDASNEISLRTGSGSIFKVKDDKVGINSTTPTANLDVVGNAKVTGIITATSFSGDGSALTGITAGIGTTASINTSGIITATSFSGDGSALTGITAGIGTTASINTSGIITAASFVGDGSNLTGITAGIGTTASINTSGIITATSFSGDGSGLTGISTFSGNYNDLTNTPTIPTNNNQLANGAGYITTSFTNTSQLINDAGFITNNVSGVLTATSFSGDGSALTGIASAVWSTNGNEAYYTSGNVGIGTTNPNVTLDVNGKVNVFGSDGNGYSLVIDPSSSGGTYETLIGKQNGDLRLQAGAGVYQANRANILLKNNGNLELSSDSSSDIVFKSNTVEKVRITSDGKIGIGTTNPRSVLEVQGTDGARITRALTGGHFSGYRFHIQNPSGNSFSLNVGRVYNSVSVTSLFNITQNGDIVPAASGQIDLGSSSKTWENIYGETLYTDDKIGHRGDTNTFIRFPAADTFTVETAGTERVRIDSAGNVGIGSTQPTANLDVNGTVNVSGISTFQNGIDVTGGDLILEHSAPRIILRDTDGTSQNSQIFQTGGSLFLDTRNNTFDGSFIMRGQGGGTGTEKLRINGAGDVGIGTSNPTAKLDVNGTLNVSGISTFTGAIDATSATIDNLTFTSGTAITSVDTDLSTVSGSDDTLASAKAIKAYVDSQSSAQDLDFAGDSGTGAVGLGTQTFTIAGTTNEIETVGSGVSLTVGLPNQVAITTSLTVASTTTLNSTGIDVTGHTETDTLNVSGISTFQSHVHLGDDDELRFGAANDFKIVHDPNDCRFENSNGDIKFKNTGSYFFFDEDGGETLASFINDGAVNLYHNNSKKFETTNTGIDVSGHTETDTLNVSGLSTFVGLSTFSSGINLPDGISVFFGTDDDGKIKHTGSNLQIQETTGNIQITNYANDKDVDITSDDGSGGTALYFKADGSTGEVKLHHYGAEKLTTKSTGIDVTGHTETDTLNVSGLSTFQDDVLIAVNNKKLTFGTGSNLQIYHIDNTDGSVIDATSNILTIGAGNFQIKNSAGTVTSAHFRSSFGQDLYYNNSLKFVTTGIGVSIANGTSDTATIAGPETLILDPAAVGDNTGTVRIKGDFIVDGTTTTVNSTTVDIADKVIGIATTCSSDLLTDGAGIGIGTNKTFLYEHNSGTNPSLKASENLNVPTGKGYQVNQVEVLNATTLGSSVVNSSLTSVGTLGALTVSGDVSIADKIIHTGDTNTAIRFPAADTFTVETAGTERVRVTSDGKFGIGTTSPATVLHIYGTSGLYTRFEQVDGKKVNFGVSNGDGIIDVTGANPLRFLNNGAETLRIHSDGKFGFGTGANIDERGHIETSTGTCRLKIQTGDTSVAGFVLQTSAIRFDIQAQNNFFQIYDNTVDEERLRITSAGNVGIGTLSPTQKLDVAGNIAIKETTVVGSATSSLSTVSQTAIHSAPIATYRSVEYTIQATQGTNFHVTKILAVHDGTTAYNSEYGTIFNNSSVATFDTDLSGGNLRLLATGASASQTDYVINFVGTKV